MVIQVNMTGILSSRGMRVMSKPFYVQCDECNEKYPGDLNICPKCGAATALCATNFMLNPLAYVYDEETYPNIFTCAITHVASGQRWIFEISDRINQYSELIVFAYKLKQSGAQMVGYNNNHFDYPILDFIMLSNNPVTVEEIYAKSQAIFNVKYGDNTHVIWENNQLITQIDLLKIHHFDNKAKHTSLKQLEFFMRMDNIRDLPYPPGTYLNNEQKDVLISYNWHDVDATIMFYVRTLDMIELRNQFSIKYGKNLTNASNTKMGLTIFQLRLEDARIECYEYRGGERYPRQTIRSSVNLAECIPDFIQFENPVFQKVLTTFKNTTLYGDNVKGLFKNFNCTIDGLTYVFGAGGQHASRSGIFKADEEYCIDDVDVEAMYPNVIKANNVYPEHLGPGFCPIFSELIDERIRVGKKTPIGMGLKEAANATYGNLGQAYYFLYDLKAMLSTTLPGQLELTMLIEQVIKIEGAIIIQTNTDGFTIRMKRSDLPFLTELVAWWERITKLKMEYNYYSRMWIRDVNNYIAEDAMTNKLKLKGAYNYNIEYHKDPSALVIPKAVEAYMVHGQCIDDFIKNHTDKFDFCLRAKVPKTNKLVMRYPDFNLDVPLQQITRYFVTNTGGFLIKIAPPRGIPGTFKRANSLTDEYFNQIINEIGPGVWDERIHTKNKSVHPEVEENGICAGNMVTDCSDMKNFNWSEIDYDWYINKAEELIIS